MVRLPLLVGTRTGGSGGMVATFSTIPLRVVENLLQVRIRGPLVRVINDKVTYRITIYSFGLKFGSPFAPAKKRHLVGHFGTRRLRSTNGEYVLHRHPYPNNVCFASPLQVSPLKHKFWDYIQARRAWRWATYTMYELCGTCTDNYD